MKRIFAGIIQTKSDRYIRGRRSNTDQRFSIPVTPRLAQIIGATDDKLIIKNKHGTAWTPNQVSSQIRKFATQAGLDSCLTPNDLRGAAETRLLMAGVGLSDIASFMGLSPNHAAKMIEKYARANPESETAIFLKLEQHEN